MVKHSPLPHKSILQHKNDRDCLRLVPLLNAPREALHGQENCHVCKLIRQVSDKDLSYQWFIDCKSKSTTCQKSLLKTLPGGWATRLLLPATGGLPHPFLYHSESFVLRFGQKLFELFFTPLRPGWVRRGGGAFREPGSRMWGTMKGCGN